MRRTDSKILKVIAVNLAVFAVLCVFGELALRWAFPDKVFYGYRHDYGDPRLIVPNHLWVGYDHRDGPSFQPQANFNPDGTRVVSNPCGGANDVTSVLIAGDSNIQAMFVPDPQSPGQILSDILNRDGAEPCFEVSSFGVSGFGPDQTLFAIEDFTARRQFDYVILHVFADNDAGDLMRNNYPRRDGKLVNDGYCYLDATIYDRLVSLKAIRKLVYWITGAWLGERDPRQSLTSSSRTCKRTPVQVFASSRAPFIETRVSRDREIFGTDARQIYTGDRYDLELACGAEDRYTQWQHEQLEIIFETFAGMAGKRDFQPIVLIEPSEKDAAFTSPRLNPKTLKAHCPGYAPENLTRFFEDAITPPTLVDTTISLLDDFRACGKCYFDEKEMPSDDHWNPAGMTIAMSRVAEMIRAYEKKQ